MGIYTPQSGQIEVYCLEVSQCELGAKLGHVLSWSPPYSSQNSASGCCLHVPLLKHVSPHTNHLFSCLKAEAGLERVVGAPSYGCGEVRLEQKVSSLLMFPNSACSHVGSTYLIHTDNLYINLILKDKWLRDLMIWVVSYGCGNFGAKMHKCLTFPD